MIPWLTVILTTILNPQLYFCCWDCKYLLHTYYHITILIAILFQISSRGSRVTHIYIQPQGQWTIFIQSHLVPRGTLCLGTLTKLFPSQAFIWKTYVFAGKHLPYRIKCNVPRIVTRKKAN